MISVVAVILLAGLAVLFGTGIIPSPIGIESIFKIASTVVTGVAALITAGISKVFLFKNKTSAVLKPNIQDNLEFRETTVGMCTSLNALPSPPKYVERLNNGEVETAPAVAELSSPPQYDDLFKPGIVGPPPSYSEPVNSNQSTELEGSPRPPM